MLYHEKYWADRVRIIISVAFHLFAFRQNRRHDALKGDRVGLFFVQSEYVLLFEAHVVPFLLILLVEGVYKIEMDRFCFRTIAQNFRGDISLK